jgi:hypothetical protein
VRPPRTAVQRSARRNLILPVARVILNPAYESKPLPGRKFIVNLHRQQDPNNRELLLPNIPPIGCGLLAS